MSKAYPFVTWSEETASARIEFSEDVHIVLSEKECEDLVGLLEMIVIGR